MNLHHQVGRAFVVAVIEHLDDMGMRKLRQSARLALEALRNCGSLSDPRE